MKYFINNLCGEVLIKSTDTHTCIIKINNGRDSTLKIFEDTSRIYMGFLSIVTINNNKGIYVDNKTFNLNTIEKYHQYHDSKISILIIKNKYVDCIADNYIGISDCNLNLVPFGLTIETNDINYLIDLIKYKYRYSKDPITEIVFRNKTFKTGYSDRLFDVKNPDLITLHQINKCHNFFTSNYNRFGLSVTKVLRHEVNIKIHLFNIYSKYKESLEILIF